MLNKLSPMWIQLNLTLICQPYALHNVIYIVSNNICHAIIMLSAMLHSIFVLWHRPTIVFSLLFQPLRFCNCHLLLLFGYFFSFLVFFFSLIGKVQDGSSCKLYTNIVNCSFDSCWFSCVNPKRWEESHSNYCTWCFSTWLRNEWCFSFIFPLPPPFCCFNVMMFVVWC